MKKILLSSGIFICSLLHAQKDTAANVLDAVVVTAGKSPQKQNETGKVITVITKEQLQQNASFSLGELLNRQTGITISGSASSPGTNQAVYTRGASAGNTLILIDGVPVYDASGISSEFDINHININQVERIEILKGAQSTMYGSDAVAGVINIITKKGNSKPFVAYGRISAGTYNTINGSAGVNGTVEKFSYNAGYTNVYSRGFSAAHDSLNTGLFDKDGMHQQTFLLSGAYKFSEKWKLRVFGNASHYTADADAAAFTDDKDFTLINKNLQTGFGIDRKINLGRVVFNYQYSMVSREYTDDSTDVPSFATYQHGAYSGYGHYAELFSNLKISNNTALTAGIDYRQSSTNQYYNLVSMFGPYITSLNRDSAITNQISPYAQFHFNVSKVFVVESGARINHHNVYGWNGTYSINPSLMLSDRWKAFANVSTAYKTPSQYQLYSEFGNKALMPEQSISYEGGLQFIKNALQARLVFFKRNIKDVIAFYTDYNTYESYYVNADRQQDNGLETEFLWKPVKNLILSANYTYVNGHITTNDAISMKDTSFFNLYRRPKNVVNADITWLPYKQFSVSTHIRSVSKFYEAVYSAAPVSSHGYYTVDLYASYVIKEKIKLFADLRNITNQQYYEIPGYNSKRFNFMTGIQLDL